MAAITERATSRSGTIGPDGTLELLYTVSGTEDDAAVRALVEATIPMTYAGLVFQNYHYKTEGGGLWEITANYGKRAPLTPQKTDDHDSYSFSCDTTGGTQKITQSLETVGSYGIGAAEVPDFQGAIGVNGDAVEGCEITVPSCQFSITVRLSADSVNLAYIATLYQLTGSINGTTWKGFPAGELLFLGASLSQRGQEDPEGTFKFAGQANRTDFPVGEINIDSKWGWDYLWVRYGDDVDGHTLIKKPTFAYVERVYPVGDFSLLGIGS